MNVLPSSRNENIVVQNLENEVLIYDTITNQAFCLNETLAKVYQHCNGKTSFDELRRKYKFTDDLIYLALDELKARKLLAETSVYQSPLAGMSRREAVRKVGLATMIALPLISTLIAPTAANAASGAAVVGTRVNCQSCATGADCASGNCRPTASGGNICARNPGGTVSPSGGVLAGQSLFSCSPAGTAQCCSGSASFSSGTGQCTCN